MKNLLVKDTTGPWNQRQEWPGVFDFIKRLHTGNLE